LLRCSDQHRLDLIRPHGGQPILPVPASDRSGPVQRRPSENDQGRPSGEVSASPFGSPTPQGNAITGHSTVSFLTLLKAQGIAVIKGWSEVSRRLLIKHGTPILVVTVGTGQPGIQQEITSSDVERG